MGMKPAAVARGSNRSPIAITRELAHTGRAPQVARPKQRSRLPVAGGYPATAAHDRACRLAAAPRCPSRLDPDGPLWPILTDLPRKSLGWKCPAELFMPNDLSFERRYRQLVALRS